jgi:hypothetical protein
VDDDCCYFPGCSDSDNGKWRCFGGHCRFLGCTTDAECAFMGGGETCHQGVGFLYGQCALECPCPDYMECLDDYDGDSFCAFHYPCFPGEQCELYEQECIDGECVCDARADCVLERGDNFDCVTHTCQDVVATDGRPGSPCSADAECDSGDCCLFAPNDCPLTDLCSCE